MDMGILRCKEEIQVEDINLEVICLEMIFKATKLDESKKKKTVDESTKGTSVDRKQVQ